MGFATLHRTEKIMVESWLKDLEDKRPQTVMGFTEKDCIGLYEFIRANDVTTVVETGVCYGFSTCYLLEAVRSNGRVISIDPCLMERNRMLIPKEHYSHWTAVKEPSSDCLDRLLKEYAPVDLFLHDSKHDYETMMMEYETAHNNNVRFIVSDDVGGPYCGTVWKDFTSKYGYNEKVIGLRARGAWRKS